MQPWPSVDVYTVIVAGSAATPQRRTSPLRALHCRIVASPTTVAMLPPLTSSPPASRGNPRADFSQSSTACSRCTAA
jgi:hypothetical protein